MSHQFVGHRIVAKHAINRCLWRVAFLVFVAAQSSTAATIVAEDFEPGASGVADFKLAAIPANPADASSLLTSDGTIDSYMGKPSHCVTLKMSAKTSPHGVAIDLRAARSGVTDLSKLSLSADIWTDHVRPIDISIASVDRNGESSGTLLGTLMPPAASAWYRHEFDLSAMKPSQGRFDPTANTFRISIAPSADRSDDPASTELRIDNLSLTAPSFYVRERGSDNADGTSEATAFATVQRAIDAAAAGDTIVITDGTYRNSGPAGIAMISKHGSPSKWITIRSAPGQKPKLVNTGWEIFKLLPGAAYIEIRGLEMSGNARNVTLEDALADGKLKEKDGKKYGGDPIYNGNGVSAEGRSSDDLSVRPHHLRYIDNYVHDNCGGGLCANFSDYITSVGNTVEHNVHYMRYGGSGMSYLALSNWSGDTSYRNYMLNNVLRDNGCYVPWAAVGKMSDGNGIIIDVNIQKTGAGRYTGRTLIANNLCIGSGGGGITITSSSHVDVVNNTLYHNVQTDDLARQHWGDILIGGPPPNCQDVRVFNNIICSAPGREILHVSRADNYTFKNNIYFGDPDAKFRVGDAGDANNLVADPLLANPSMTAVCDEFRPKPSSPAIGHGAVDGVDVPRTDLDGAVRPLAGPITAGAFQNPSH